MLYRILFIKTVHKYCSELFCQFYWKVLALSFWNKPIRGKLWSQGRGHHADCWEESQQSGKLGGCKHLAGKSSMSDGENVQTGNEQEDRPP